MVNLKVSDIHEVKLENLSSPFHSEDIERFTLPLLPEVISLNLILKDDYAFNLPYLHCLHPRHKWRSILPKKLQYNVWITQIDDDEPITGECVSESLRFSQVEDMT